MRTCLSISLALALLLAGSGPAAAAIPVCVEARGAADQQAALQALVLNELAHHPDHALVEGDCPNRLEVELLSVAGELFLTARLNREIPVRFTLKDPRDLDARLAEAVTLVLQNDPQFLLEDVSRLNASQRAAHAILKRGNSLWRLEFFQAVSPLKESTAFAPGGAVELTRGADHWQAFARVYLALGPGEARGAQRKIRLLAGGDGGVQYEFNQLTTASWYVGGGAGLQWISFEGLTNPVDLRSTDTTGQYGMALNARVGLRLLRLYNFDCDVFAMGYLPIFKTFDADSVLMGDSGAYTPTLQLGLGVGF